MTLGGSNVWTNFSYGYRNESPCGWLLNPDQNRLILFTRNKKSARNNLRIFAHTYYVNAFREPVAIKSSNQIPIEEAWNKWNQLQLKGWTFQELELTEPE